MSKESQLIKDLKKDENLSKDRDKRVAYLSLGRHFVADLQTNIFSTAFELADGMSGTTVEEWTDFLSYPVVSKFTNKIVSQHTAIQAAKDIAEGVKSKDALAVQKAIAEREGQGSNHDIVVMMMPVRKAYGK